MLLLQGAFSGQDKDGVENPQMSLGPEAHGMILFSISALTLLVGRLEGIQPVNMTKHAACCLVQQ